jgi:hypothetical protein
MPETLTHPTPPSGAAAEPPSGVTAVRRAGDATAQPAAPRHRHLAESALAGAKTRHERMMDEARRIIDAGNDRDVVVRLTGGLAVRHYAIDLDFAERDYSDIDLVGLRRQAGELHDLFADLGYLENLYVAQAAGNGQRQFFKPAEQLESRAHFTKRGGRYLPVVTSVPPADHIDVFLDAMRMDHVIEMRERLTLNTYAISPADLFLSKLQIFYLNEKDVHDVVTLCKDVYVDFDDRPGVLNLRYVAETCADDWGLYVDLMSNVDAVLERLDQYDLTVNEFTRVRRTLELAQAMMTDEAKSLRWRLRARVGKRLAWRREVEDTGGRGPDEALVAVRTKAGRAVGA